MQTRSKSCPTTINSSETTARNYRTRLGNRIMKLNVTIAKESNDQTNTKGPAYNTRLAHNVLSPKSYCISREIKTEFIPPSDHNYNTRYSCRCNNLVVNKEGLDVNINFDEASREWNRNKRRVGQMYEYTY